MCPNQQVAISEQFATVSHHEPSGIGVAIVLVSFLEKREVGLRVFPPR